MKSAISFALAGHLTVWARCCLKKITPAEFRRTKPGRKWCTAETLLHDFQADICPEDEVIRNHGEKVTLPPVRRIRINRTKSLERRPRPNYLQLDQ